MSAITDNGAACESRWHLVGPTRAQPVCLECRDEPPVEDDEEFCPKCFAGMDAANHDECVDLRRPAPGVSDEAVEAAQKAWTKAYWTEAAPGKDDWMRAALQAALPLLTGEPECGAVDRTGERRCVFTPGHHEVEKWTSHGDRGGWTWNDQPAED